MYVLSGFQRLQPIILHRIFYKIDQNFYENGNDMKIIETYQINNFKNHDAIFFTEDGVVVDKFTHSPFIDFLETIKRLKIELHEVFLDGNTIIVSCNFSVNNEFIEKFTIYKPKSFITIADQNIQRQMLRAIHWLTWNERLRHCSKCGSALKKGLDLTEKKCSFCNLSFFPNLSPAIMVLIQRGDKVLLARSAHFKEGMYSAIAGFIDIGETAESAVHREVFEEVGLKIKSLKYFGSQSWPFPSSFMIAFTAEYLDGEIIIDQHEIEDARWFNLNNLPDLPPLPSIARQLIDSCNRLHG